MDRPEALGVLGVSDAEASDPGILRRAFRARMMTVHPDLNPGSGATAATMRLSAAYEVLVASPPAPGPKPESVTPPVEVLTVVLVDDSTVRLDAGRDEALAAVVEAAHRLGEIGYLDAQAGLVEVVVEFVEAPTSSVLITLQGRAEGMDLFCSVEPLSGGDSPPLGAVTALVARTLSGVTRRGG